MNNTGGKCKDIGKLSSLIKTVEEKQQKSKNPIAIDLGKNISI